MIGYEIVKYKKNEKRKQWLYKNVREPCVECLIQWVTFFQQFNNLTILWNQINCPNFQYNVGLLLDLTVEYSHVCLKNWNINDWSYVYKEVYKAVIVHCIYIYI